MVSEFNGVWFVDENVLVNEDEDMEEEEEDVQE